MKRSSIRTIFAAFPQCFLALTAFFVLIYFFAQSQGAPSFDERADLPLINLVLSIFTAITVFSFWLAMLIDFLKTDISKNKVLWGIAFIFFSWVTALFWFLTRIKIGRNQNDL